MKKKTKIIIGALTVTVVAAAAITAGYISNVKSKKAVMPESFTITAHTGCEGAKDNSIEAIELGIAAGANIVEFDLSFNSEGEAYLAHDEIEEDSVTLKQAFETVAKYDKIRVNVDCKSTQNLKLVSEIASECGILDRIFYTGIGEDAVQAAKSATPEVPYYLNTDIDKSKKNDDEYIKGLIDKTKALGAIGINIGFGGASERMTELFHAEGLEVSVYTVNSSLDMHKVLSLGCDNITTRQPKKLTEIIKTK